MKLQFDESQNIEYKESWNDKYLEWICGFANAQGGRIIIGVNDAHEVIFLEQDIIEGNIIQMADKVMAV